MASTQLQCRVVPQLSKNSAVGDSALVSATGLQGRGAQQEGSCRCSIQHLKPPVVLLQPNQVVHPLDRFNTGSRCLAPPRENSCTPANDSRKPHPDEVLDQPNEKIKIWISDWRLSPTMFKGGKVRRGGRARFGIQLVATVSMPHSWKDLLLMAMLQDKND